MRDEEMGRNELISTLVAIRESAKEHNEAHTEQLINKILEELRKK